ncbi:MAG: ABC transporter permease subunit [Pseudomonadota bacterium]
MFLTLVNIAHKELIDALRDRRSVAISLTFAIFGPAFLYLMLDGLAKDTAQSGEVQLAVVGAEAAPALIDHLEQNGVQLHAAETVSLARALLSDKVRTILEVPSFYADHYAERQPIALRLTGDFKDSGASGDVARVRKIVEAYGSLVANGRLIAAGIAPPRVNPFRVQTYDLSRAGGRSAAITNSLIYMFLIAAFVTGAFMTADAVAGERERHSLEALLVQPASPLSLIIGKWLACGAISVVVSIVTVVVGAALLTRAPLAELGLRLTLDTKAAVLASVVLTSLSLFAVGLQVMLAARAKTYREAGISGQLTVFLPVAVAGALLLGRDDFGVAALYAPITGHALLLRDTFLDGAVSLTQLATVTLTSTAAVGAMLVVGARWFGDHQRL